MNLVIYEQNVDTVSIMAMCTEETIKECVVKLTEEFKRTIEKGNSNSKVWMLPATISLFHRNPAAMQDYYFNSIKVGCQIVTSVDGKTQTDNMYQEFDIQEVTDDFNFSKNVEKTEV